MKKSVYALFLLILGIFLGVGGLTLPQVQKLQKTSLQENILQTQLMATEDCKLEKTEQNSQTDAQKEEVSKPENLYEENAFRILRQANSSGQIGLSYIFPVNSTLLAEQGFSEEEIKTFRFYLSVYVNALAQQNRQNATKGVTVGNCAYYTDVDGIGFSIVFESLDAQRKFFGVEDDGSSGGTENKTSGFFIKTVCLETTFPVSSVQSAENLKQVCKMALSSWANDKNLENVEQLSAVYDNSLFIYDFATTSDDLRSEFMYDDDNFHHNVFFKTLSDIENDNTISFYVSYANTPVWYLSAILLVIVGMGLAYVVLKRKKRVAETKKSEN